MSLECKENRCIRDREGLKREVASGLKRRRWWSKYQCALLSALLLFFTFEGICGSELGGYNPGRQLLQAGTVFSGGVSRAVWPGRVSEGVLFVVCNAAGVNHKKVNAVDNKCWL